MSSPKKDMSDLEGEDVKSAGVKPNNPTSTATITPPVVPAAATTKQEKGQNDTKILDTTRDSKEGEDSNLSSKPDSPQAAAAVSTKKKIMTDNVKPPSSVIKENEKKKSALSLAPGRIESLHSPSVLASLHKRASSELPPTSQIEGGGQEPSKGGLKSNHARSESRITIGAAGSLSLDKKINPSSSSLALASQSCQNNQYPSKGTIALAPGRSDSTPGAVASLPQDGRAKSSSTSSGLSLAPGVEPRTSATVEQGEPRPFISLVPGAHRIHMNGVDTGDSGHLTDDSSHHSPTATPQPSSNVPKRTQRNAESTDEEQPMLEAAVVEDAVVGEAVPVRAQLAKKCFRVLVLMLLVTLLAVGLAVVFIGGNEEKAITAAPTTAPTTAPTVDIRRTLDVILERGFLRCGVQDNLLGFSMLVGDSSERDGFEVDMCRAMAAAVFGQGYSTKKVQLVKVSLEEQWPALRDRKLDLVTRTTTYTMERDVHQRDAGVGFTFSIPYMYDGLGFAGIQPYVKCADELRVADECSNLTICTISNSTHWDTLSALLPASRLVASNETHSRMDSFLAGSCNVIAGERKDSSEAIARNAGYTGDKYVLGTALGTAQYSKEPLALVTRAVDSEWSRFVDLVLQAVIEAEVQKVTKETAHQFYTTLDPGAIFDVEHQDMFVHAIRAVGNYGDMYNRHLAPILPRNLVNRVPQPGQDTGLRYALPFGSVQVGGPGAAPGGMLEDLNRRRYLRCGIRSANVFEGSLDKQYCRAVSASVFSGMVNIRYKLFDDPSVGADMLQSGEIDVLAGASARKATRDGLKLSPPYSFHEVNGDDLERDAVVLATLSNDTQWSDFVYWLVSGMTYAEENEIIRQKPNEMPTVELFGPTYTRMFRDAILVVGNAGEMFVEAANSTNSSSVAEFARGMNALNNQKPLGSQFYPFL